MGFLYYAISIPRALTATFLLGIFTNARFILTGALSRLGLYKPPPEQESAVESNGDSYILILDPSFPSLVPVPVRAVVAAIKNRVRIVRFRDYCASRRGSAPEIDEVDSACSICLERVGLDDWVRDLCICSHLFHVQCLDTWIDEGQVTCPLCRSMLLPPKINLFLRCNQSPDGLAADL
ncbi:RING/U-box superfamily protein [Striga asiatica]|uniref:RING/U-box superfamily protein n=1 Tax=Striga asiatica TaxID=4170 RepID=A0A5A7QEG8_STRAF|nr:RING/U-box superfamily protein [Striga asiatica]